MLEQINLFNKLDTSTKVGVFGLVKGLNALYILKTFYECEKNVLVVVNDNTDINNLYNELISYDAELLTFPMDSYALARADAISPEFMQERLDTLIKLSKGGKYIVITSLEGATTPILPRESYLVNLISLKVGNTIDQVTVEKFLVDNNYERVSVVSQTGEFALRGHVLDVFLEDSINPVRVEFWGDEIDSIREFDFMTQRTIKIIDKVDIYPNPDLNAFDSKHTLSNFVDGYNIVYDYSQIKTRYDDFHNDNSIFMLDDYDLYLNELDSVLNINTQRREFHSKSINAFNNNYDLLNEYIAAKMSDNYQLIISVDFKSQADLLKSKITFDCIEIDSIEELEQKKVNIVIRHQFSSFEFDDCKICLINSASIFSKTNVSKKYLNKYKFSSKITNISELKCNDYIVHETHGIGQYVGIKTITSVIDGQNYIKDYFEISYKNSDKLYVPVEQISLIQKYSHNSTFEPKLNKLGGIEWEKTKRRISGRMEEVAQKLLQIYAQRAATQGFACDGDSVEAIIFENEFEFEETKDQLRAIAEIKSDMESPTPMDRLLCGDVGFGKTEVAFRAAYKAMDNNKQVAYLCPTTILSIQQYENALKRFANVPINIALINRYTTTKQHREILEKLKDGRIDFIFGTHSLLSDKIIYKDLGLLIVDEEQRFGVEHKEKIKEIKLGVDVLTLTATPIPRTLQMSLLGIRSLSIIDTAPVNRFPIQTYVIGHDEQIIKEAILKEIKRGGQVFVLNNTISKQSSVAKLINKLVPRAIVDIANGKMNKANIEEVFHRFNNHEFDVLVSTTIIETGINIPNANTLIIMEADRFGLSQLYQIRGRVGRSDNIAYAYLMYSPDKILTQQARQRLEVIKNFTTLGSGFKIASRDLSIRGAGDILGAEQAGFIDTIGVELYMKMLKDVLNKSLDEETIIEETRNVPLVNYSNHIPNDYVIEDEVKLTIHKKIQTISDTDSYHDVKSELSDIYGRVPTEVEQYMNEVLLDSKIKNMGILKIDDEKKAVKVLLNNSTLDGVKLLNAINLVGRHIRILNKQDVIYLIIDKTKCDNWKIELQKLIDLYLG